MFVFGPVPSRRLGRSLGIDPIPFKACNYNCVYCQLGRTRRFTTQRHDFFPPEAILEQAASALQGHSPGEIDFVTFVGQGEPLLCASLGRLIRGVKQLTSLPVAVITNGSLLNEPSVREDLLAADTVIPTLDAIRSVVFRRINRPHPSIRLRSVLEGLRDFRREYTGQLWIEVMLVKGLNDDREHLLRLGEVLQSLCPDAIQINVPVRPPAEPWVCSPDVQALQMAVAALGEKASLLAPCNGAVDLSGEPCLLDTIADIVRRHPIPESELRAALAGYGAEQVDEVLARLEGSGRAQPRSHRGEVFWSYSGDEATF